MDYAAEASILYTTKTFRQHADRMHPLIACLRKLIAVLGPQREQEQLAQTFWRVLANGAPLDQRGFEANQWSQTRYTRYMSVMMRIHSGPTDIWSGTNWFGFFACENETVFQHVWHRAMAMYVKAFGRLVSGLSNHLHRITTVTIASEVRDVVDAHMCFAVMKHNEELRRGDHYSTYINWTHYRDCHNIMSDTIMDHSWLCRFLYDSHKHTDTHTHTDIDRPIETYSHVICNVELFRKTVFTKTDSRMYSYFSTASHDYACMLPHQKFITTDIIDEIRHGTINMCIFEPRIVIKCMNAHASRYKLHLTRSGHEHVAHSIKHMVRNATEMNRLYTCTHEATVRTIEKLRVARVESRKQCSKWDGKEKRMKAKTQGRASAGTVSRRSTSRKRDRADSDSELTDIMDALIDTDGEEVDDVDGAEELDDTYDGADDDAEDNDADL